MSLTSANRSIGLVSTFKIHILLFDVLRLVFVFLSVFLKKDGTNRKLTLVSSCLSISISSQSFCFRTSVNKTNVKMTTRLMIKYFFLFQAIGPYFGKFI